MPSCRATAGSTHTSPLCSSTTCWLRPNRPWAPPRRAGDRAKIRPISPLIELQFDAAIAPEGDLVIAGIERAELGEAGGNQPIGRQALALEIFDDRDCAGAGQ